MKAVIIGGTGATGRELVKHLLDDSRFEQVIALVRRPSFDPHPKLTEEIVNFEQLEKHKNSIQGDIAFSCLGTTLKDAGNKTNQWRVDHDYQLEFAKLAKSNGIERFVLLSAFGADVNSSFFYNKMKGVLEQNIQQLNFDQLIILHPGGIERPGSTRTNEKIMIKALKAFNAIGLFTNYSPVTTHELAKAILNSTFSDSKKYKIVSLKEIKALIRADE